MHMRLFWVSANDLICHPILRFYLLPQLMGHATTHLSHNSNDTHFSSELSVKRGGVKRATAAQQIANERRNGTEEN